MLQHTAMLMFGFCLLFSTSAVHSKGGVMSLTLVSSAFTNQNFIPARYTCEGEDISPPLSWSGLPKGTSSLVLIVDDPDAPDPAAPRMTWVHWLLYNLPLDIHGLEEAVVDLPPGTLQGSNDFGHIRYGGPCPPIGRHRYFFKLYALDIQLPDLKQPNKSTLLQAMQGHVLAESQLIGLYQKQK